MALPGCRGGLSLLVLLTTLFSVPASATSWTEIPMPPGAHHASALQAGHEWLYAAWCIPTGTTIGLYRTPLSAPGVWERLGIAFRPIHDILLIGAADDTVFVAANSDTSVYRSFDGGLHWSIGDTAIAMESGHALAWTGVVPGRLLVEGRETQSGHERRYRSDDLGSSWSVIGSPYTANYKPFLAAARDGSRVVYQSVYGGYWISTVMRSLDGGDTWQMLPGDFWTFVHDLDVRPNDPLCVCALMGGASVPRWCGTSSLGEWPTPWTATGTALPGWDPGRVFLAGLDAQGRPVAAWRDWEGSEWNAYSEGLSVTTSPGAMNQWLSYHLAAALDRALLFYATLDHGLWMREVDDLPSSVEQDPPPSVHAPRLVATPNPTRAAMRLTHPAAAVLEIYDATGRHVRTLLPAGEESIWDGRDAEGRMLPSGIYHVRSPGSAPVSVVLVR